ncbi:flagellar hook-length control protein FliK [Candidatus Levibacter sp. Uisw_134_01]|uniref:flagellar hook-length control protein FliK n=1 Tax=Candidatus Levibacter sp. Uisw_134_01 TaxID=3230999 RepID=UPI003D4AB49C
MNINTDTNQTIDKLSGLNGEAQDTSVLNSLFSINFKSEEMSSDNNIIDKEYIFDEDDIKILDNIFHIIPDFESKKNNLPDLDKIKNMIKLDENLSETKKHKILNLIKSDLTNLKEIKLDLSGSKSFKNLLSEKSLKSPENLIENRKLLNNEKNNTKFKNLKNIHNIKFNQQDIIIKDQEKLVYGQNQEPEAKDQKRSSLRDQLSSFVKKVKKNNHPNKIYNLAKVSNIENSQLNNSSSHFDAKIINNAMINLQDNQTIEKLQKNKIYETKNKENTNLSTQQLNHSNNSANNYSQNGSTSFSNNGYNSVLENFLDNLDLTQKGWSSKLVSKIQNSLADGGGEIEFNLKPKNLGMLKVSVRLKEGIGSVKIIAENSFVTTALNQNENYLQKLFNDQGINLEFLAKNENQNFGSNNQSNQNSNNEKENQNGTAEKKVESLDEMEIEDNSSRHIINVIA